MPKPRGPAHQSGAVSIGSVMLLVLMLSSFIVALLVSTNTSVNDSMASEKSTAAIFLAESGVERAQSSVARAIAEGGYTNATCTGLSSTPAVGLGRGTFSYEHTQSTPAICGGWNAPCTECRFVALGQVGEERRRVQTQIQAKLTNGVQGHGSTFTLQLRSQKDGAAAFTNLAYRATATLASDVSSNAYVGSCNNSGGTCSIANAGWDMQRTGTNNVSNMGVFAQVTLAGFYTITDTLRTNSGALADRNYAHTGILFYPSATSTQVNFVGHYAVATGGNSTASTSQVSGTLPTGWTCNANSGTSPANMGRAALADTLVYGFSSKPVSADRQLSSVKLGMHPLKKAVSLTGDQGDLIYSQIWYSWNPAFAPSNTASSSGTTVTFSGTTVAPATGTTLAVYSGTGAFDSADFVASVDGKVMTVSSVSKGSLKVGDAVFGSQISPATRITAQLGGATGGVGTYQVCQTTTDNSCAEQIALSAPATARVGVVAQLSANSISVSRAPSVALSGASVCGGVCAFFFAESGSNTTYTLSNVTSGDDWASGFACLAGVDPASAKVLGTTELKRTYWAEPNL